MTIHTTSKNWILETKQTAYALGLNDEGVVTHAYWGAKLPYITDYPAPPPPREWASFSGTEQMTPEEYPAYAGMKFIDPCLKVTFADGVRDAVLRFDKAETVDGELRLHLHDAHYLLHITLHYRSHVEYDLIERYVTVTNEGHDPITLERIWSAQWHLPQGEKYHLTHLAGRWFEEMNLYREPLMPGLKVLESRRMTTSHNHNPWFAVDKGHATEETGEVWFGVLAWSGNWKLSAEVTDAASTRINLGLNDWDFAWRLNAGESFVTPSSLAGYSAQGFGAASRNLHNYIRNELLPHGHALHKVLYNSWEATIFEVDIDSQTELAGLAAEMGVELFVVDDGWFHGRNHDRAGLGDWWADEQKFPQGLTPLIERVNKLGMDFGLWIEPEMVNPDSELYRQHPDWVIHFPTRARTEARNQLMLNMARPEVQTYLIGQLDKLLTNHNITFIKWDMNRNVSEPGWADAPGDPREIWVRYVQGVHHVWGTLRERHPQVFWQSCSGGGGRADLAMLRLADQIWTSDNTEPAKRLEIQEGFSHVFPANVMESWVTDMNPSHMPLEFRMHVSMAGSLGIGGHLRHWSEAERADAAKWIAYYKEIRPIIQLGQLYRLRSPQAEPFSAMQYMSQDGAAGVLMVFRTHLAAPVELPPLYLRGLEPTARYEVEGMAGSKSGLAWMNTGLYIHLPNFQSTVRRITRVD